MEKSSEKVIGSSRLAPNPFNNLMSEVQIKINQPKSTKKIDNYALEIDSNIDRSASNYLPEPTRPAKKDSPPQSQSKIVHQNVYLINVPLKTKHSSDTVGRQKSEKDIINEWLIGFMAKRHLLGVHWEENFGEKNEELMQVAFQRIKGRAENSMECNTQ
jgi:riboflavin synthase